MSEHNVTDHDVADRKVDELLEDLDSALRVDVPPGFQARVRVRVGERPSWFLSRTTWMSLAATAAVVTLAVVASRPAAQADREAADVSRESTVAQARPEMAQATPLLPSQVPSQATVKPEATVAMSTPPPRPAAIPTMVDSPVATSVKLPTVITKQAVVLRALWSEHEGRTLVLAEGGEAVSPEVSGVLEIAPLVVADVVVPELVVAPIAVAQWDSNSRPGGRAAAEVRRANAAGETK